MPGRTTPLSELTPNPRNPRDDLGDLSDLASIADMQLQPAVVVTKAAYLRLYPDDTITARYVVVNGCRRLAAAHKYGRTDLAVVVNDEIARDRITLISASIAENVDRQDFDVIEEAKAVEALVRSAAAPTRRRPGCTRPRPGCPSGARCCRWRPNCRPRCAAASWPSARRAPWPGCRSSSRSPAGGPRWTRRTPTRRGRGARVPRRNGRPPVPASSPTRIGDIRLQARGSRRRPARLPGCRRCPDPAGPAHRAHRGRLAAS